MCTINAQTHSSVTKNVFGANYFPRRDVTPYTPAIVNAFAIKYSKQVHSRSCQGYKCIHILYIISPDINAKPKKFWSFIKSKKFDAMGVSALRANNGLTYTDSISKANILNRQFESVFNKETTKVLQT